MILHSVVEHGRSTFSVITNRYTWLGTYYGGVKRSTQSRPSRHELGGDSLTPPRRKVGLVSLSLPYEYEGSSNDPKIGSPDPFTIRVRIHGGLRNRLLKWRNEILYRYRSGYETIIELGNWRSRRQGKKLFVFSSQGSPSRLLNKSSLARSL